MNDYQFGNHLYRLRHQAGYTQKEVADHCGVSNKAVSKWENGKTKPGAQIIRKLAERGPGIFVGRCADYVLGDYSNVVNTFIYAYKDDRINRIMDIYKLSEKEAVDKIKKIDRERRLYYEGRTDRKWGSIDANAILMNTSLLGIDGAVDALEAIYHKWENR